MTFVPPDLSFEAAAIADGHLRIAGVDEVGRGPLAGPVMACAVVLDPARIPPGLRDSKVLGAARRRALADIIPTCAAVGYGMASVAEIEMLNILAASHLAMLRAVADLPLRPDFALIDGNRMPPGLPCPARLIVRGDSRSLSIAAASIMAKVWRDRWMVDLAQQHPGYGWETNAGYPTRQHHDGLKCHGVTPHHRRTFAPIHKILWQDKNLNE